MRENEPILIIDAGHGGKDVGGGSCNLFIEKDMNLLISLYQFQRCKDMGINVILTRDKDIYISYSKRAEMIRESGATYCISNHINSVVNKNVSGAEVIYSIHADDNLAYDIMDELVKEGLKNRRVFTKILSKNQPNLDFYFMHRLTGSVETVIVEYGFASNEIECKKIYDNWRIYADACLRGYCKRIGHIYVEVVEEEDIIEDYKLEGINYFYENGLLKDESWKEKFEEPLPLWALGLVLKRLNGDEK